MNNSAELKQRRENKVKETYILKIFAQGKTKQKKKKRKSKRKNREEKKRKTIKRKTNGKIITENTECEKQNTNMEIKEKKERVWIN